MGELKAIAIEDIIEQIERLCPEQVDDTPAPNGQSEVGYTRHEYYGDDGNLLYTIGHYCQGGNAGIPVWDIPESNLPAVHEALAALPDGDVRGCESALEQYQ